MYGYDRLTLTDSDGVEQLHRSALEVLASTGLNVHHEPMRKRLAANGAGISDGPRVTLPEEMVAQALATPSRLVTIHDRSGSPALSLTPHQIYFGTGSDLFFTRDARTGQRRGAVLEDVARSKRLCDALPEIDFLMSFATPGGVAAELVEPRQYHAMVSYSTKPVIMTVCSGLSAFERLHDMACAVAESEEVFREQPNYVMYGQFVSPLQHDRGAIVRLVFSADHEIPLIYVPTIMPGVSGPVTLAGSLALAIAESLAGLVMHQLQRPGAPFIFGACVGAMGLRTALFADAFGNPDPDPIYDLDGSGSVDFTDFFMFADAFGSGGRAKLFSLAEEMIGLPRAVSLAQNYPNRFNSATTIDYELRSASGVVLEVYDLSGQRVRRLVDHYQEGGRYQVSWDGLDETGDPLSSGVYLMRLQALSRVETRKMMLMK